MKVMLCTYFLHPPVSVSISSSSSFPSSSRSSLKLSVCCSAMEDESGRSSKFKEYPFVSVPHKSLMLDLVSTLENRLQSQLLPSTLPPYVQHCQNTTSTNQASLHFRAGHPDSSIDFIWGAWVHSELPTGGALDITSLFGYLNSSNDAPNFVFDMIRHSPTVLVFILDLSPRKDLVLWPDDLKTFYEDTQLDKHRQALATLPEVQPYISPSLYMRTLSSPTTIMVRIQTENDGGERMEEIIKNHLDPISKQVLGIWLDHCAFAKREVGDAERGYLKKRDGLIRNKSFEIDLESSLLLWFGPEVANPVLEVIKEYFTV
ncbi:hypothetical protein RIF29_18130 [Crotalaria pallida]|uniref:Red chlorophyll catabolite reductase n=1 Tax=Crotalaria pallida TaxID=3830 RepID=A0AAN9FKN3_CROPI